MKLLYSIMFLVLSAGCQRKAVYLQNAQAPVVVYKCKGKFHDKVPVQLNEAKTEIVSYPHPKDLIVAGQLRYPIKLKQGYWLDNQGLGLNTAFLKMDYDTYSQLEEVPSLKELFAMVEESDPFTEFYIFQEGINSEDLVVEINGWIKKGMLAEKGKRLK